MQIEIIKLTRGALITADLKKQMSRLQIKGRKIKIAKVGVSKSPTLRLIFAGPAQIKKLNKQYRGKNKVTDVLSFDSDEPQVLGELILCWSQIRKQAKEFKVSAQDELLFLALHGLLHLLGYDHEQNARQAAKMFALQKNLIEILKPQSRGLKNGAFDRVI